LTISKAIAMKTSLFEIIVPLKMFFSSARYQAITKRNYFAVYHLSWYMHRSFYSIEHKLNFQTSLQNTPKNLAKNHVKTHISNSYMHFCLLRNLVFLSSICFQQRIPIPRAGVVPNIGVARTPGKTGALFVKCGPAQDLLWSLLIG